MTHIKGQHDANLHDTDGNHRLPHPGQRYHDWLGDYAVSGAGVQRWDTSAPIYKEQMTAHFQAHLDQGDILTHADCAAASGCHAEPGRPCRFCGTQVGGDQE